jgi:hypothetical protein
MDRACSTHGREEGCVQGFGGKPEGKTPLGRPRPRCEDKIKIDLRKIRWGIDGNHMAQDIEQWWALVKKVMDLRIL